MNKIKRSGFLVLSSIFLSVLLGSYLQKPNNNNYISFEYSYEHTEKPIPQIIFYTDKFVVDEMTFVGYKFEIKKVEFLSVEREIKTKSSYLIIDSSARRYFNITVVKDGKRTIYGTVNRNKTQILFDSVLNKLRSSQNYSQISKAFKQVYSELQH